VRNILPGQRQNSHPYRKALLWLLIVLVVATSYGAYYWWNAGRAKPQYVTAEVSQGDIERSVNVTGSINPRVTVQVGSYVSGTIKSLSCDFNTEVKAGQICAKIDPSTFQVVVDQNTAQVKSGQAQLHKDEAALVYAKAVYERDTKLLKDGIVAQEVLDNDKNVFKQASSQIELDKATIVAQEASLKSAVVNLGYTNIVSPVTGTVLTRSVDVGQTVASSLQTPTLFLIGKDLTKMQVDANVSEADVGRIKVAQDVTFSVQAYPEKQFEGTVKQIRRGPITVQNVVTYDVVVSVDNPELLLFPGMTADAEIVTDSRENVLRVPLAATRFTPERVGRSGGEPPRNVAANHSDDRGARRDDKRDEKQGDKTEETHAGKHGAKAKIAVAEKADEKPMDQVGESGKREAGAEQHEGRGAGRGDDRWQHRGEHQGERRDWDRGEHRGDHRHGDEAHPADKERKGEDARASAKVDAEKNDKATESDSNKTTGRAVAKPEAQPKKRARVWVLRDGVPQPVWLTTGLDDGDMIEVLEGELKPGDKVIVNEVRPVETKATSTQLPFGQQGGRRAMGRP